MVVLYLLFLMCAVILFAMAAYGVSARKFNLMAAGLFFLALVPFLQTVQKL